MSVHVTLLKSIEINTQTHHIYYIYQLLYYILHFVSSENVVIVFALVSFEPHEPP